MAPRSSLSLVSVLTAVQLVLQAGAALRAVPRIMAVTSVESVDLSLPAASTVRTWMLRLGHFALQEQLQVATDWIFLIDLSVQIGVTKLCVIVGVRQCQLPPRGQSLELADLTLIGLHPVQTSTGEVVAEQLREAACRVGIPREIVSDHGSDVKKGCELFAAEHSRTAVVYDTPHRGACLLKQRLEAHPQWSKFLSQLGQTRARVLQTTDACLASPSLRPKARYMNLTSLLKWGLVMLRLVDRAASGDAVGQRALARYGWLRKYRGALSLWWRWDVTIRTCVSFVRTEGLTGGCEADLQRRLCERPENERQAALERELIEFVRGESASLKPGERLIGSTEVLESLFGKWKQRAHQEASSGITSYALSLGALVGEWSPARIHQALTATSNKQVGNWLRDNLPVSVQAERRRVLANSPSTNPARSHTSPEADKTKF